jgi:hypothetical protein
VFRRTSQANTADQPFREGANTMPSVITPEILAERVCRTLDLPAKENAESLTEILRVALTETRD